MSTTNELLRKWLEKFGDAWDAGPPREGWQSDELLALIEQTRAALVERKAEPVHGVDGQVLVAAREMTADQKKQPNTDFSQNRGEGAALRDILSGLAMYLGVGSGDEGTTAEQYDKRIRQGIDMLTEPLARDAERYRRLRRVGVAPAGTLHLEQGAVLVTSNLDEWVDAYNRNGLPVAPAQSAEFSASPSPVDSRELIERLVKALEEIAASRRMNCHEMSDEERAEYWSALALRYRSIASKALAAKEQQP